MPINMDPSKKRQGGPAQATSFPEPVQASSASTTPPPSFGEETEVDREKDLAEAELNNLWDATEVIDMDKV